MADDDGFSTEHQHLLQDFIDVATAAGVQLMHVVVTSRSRDTLQHAPTVVAKSLQVTVTLNEGALPLQTDVVTPHAIPPLFRNSFLVELAAKLVLNALTTGGHILKGKILRNRMVDVQVNKQQLTPKPRPHANPCRHPYPYPYPAPNPYSNPYHSTTLNHTT